MIVKILKNAFKKSSHESIKILMYHHVLPAKLCEKNPMFVTTENLEEQLLHIRKNYNTVFFKDLENSKELENKIILTFDDGYYDNLEYLLPLLKRHQLKATIFIPTKLILDRQNEKEKMFMTFEEIKNLDPNFIEIALHSHHHLNFSEMNLEDAKADLIKNMETLEEQKIPFTRVLAYPFGKFPKERHQKEKFFQLLDKLGILYALRIGNGLESYPFQKRFEIKRIDIRYEDTFEKFKWKLRLGKLKL